MRPLKKKNRLVLVISFTTGILLIWVYGWCYLHLPLFLLLLPTLSLIALAGIFYIMDLFAERIAARREASLTGKCSHCGYDLRASKLRCPECGTPIPPEKPVAKKTTPPILPPLQ